MQFLERQQATEPREALRIMESRDSRETGRMVDSREAELSIRSLVDEPNWECATVERLDADRITTRPLPFNLGKAVLQHDPTEDLALQPGDVVTILSLRDNGGPQACLNRLVQVEREVDRPGIDQLQLGQTLRRLPTRAGGFTPQAYVLGLELAPEETRQRQRENLQAAAARLEPRSPPKMHALRPTGSPTADRLRRQQPTRRSARRPCRPRSRGSIG